MDNSRNTSYVSSHGYTSVLHGCGFYQRLCEQRGKEGLSSKAGVKGIVKKVGYLCVIIVAMFFDYIIMYALSIMGLKYEITMFFGLLVTVWFILNELLSILENVAGLGVPIPDFLTRYVKDVRGKINKKGEENLHD